jgi:acetylornithine deacetylase/succinyl-diaminopimelate desuccinylase-like protein
MQIATEESDRILLRGDMNSAAPAFTPTDKELERLLDDLIAFPSVSDNHAANHAALDYIAKYLQERGMYIQRFDPTATAHEALIASTRMDNAKRPAILLAAHVDVIGADPAMFSMRHENGKYIGRGVLDMKFAIAGYLKVVDELRQSLRSYDFAIFITSDEELGGRDGVNSTREFVQSGYLPKVVVLPDGGADWQLVTCTSDLKRMANLATALVHG